MRRRLSDPPLGLDPSRPASRLERILSIAPGFADAAKLAIAQRHAAALAEEERHRASLNAPVPTAGDNDLGPEHNLRRRRVVVVDALDPAQPRVTIRRAVVADPIARMVSRGELQPRHLEAAELLRDLVALAEAGSPSALTRLGQPGGGSAASREDAYRVGTAHAALERAWRACWPYGPVVAWVALGRNTIEAFALARKVRRSEVPGWLRTGMTLLADHFGCDPKRQHC